MVSLWFLISYAVDIKVCIIGLLCILVAFFTLRLLTTSGAFKEARFHEDVLKKSRMLYLNNKGPYENLYYRFEEMKKETKETFRISRHFSIFYNDPKQTNPNDCCSTFGVLVNDGELQKIPSFLKQHPEYGEKTIFPMKCQSCIFPYSNVFSYILTDKKVYPKLRQISQRKVDREIFSMQILNCVPSNGHKTLQILTGFENQSELNLWRD